MSQMIKLDITQDCYEGLRCSVCDGYLSLSPIRWLPDGSVLCGRCQPLNNEISYRALIVESLLSNAAFPCSYEQFGCSTNVLFNRALNHEAGCIHRPFPCASLPYTSCAWEGSQSQVSDHFSEKHSDFVEQEAKIKLKVGQDKKGVLLVKAAPASFIVTYAFDSTISSFRYQIRLCIEGMDSQDGKLQLFNDFDPENSVNLKTKCLAYNADFSNDNFLNVDVSSMFAALNNPDNLTVVFHVKLPMPADDGSSNNEGDYKLGKSDQCISTPTSEKILENTLTQKRFPCRWEGCNFVGKEGDIERHQAECDFRIYCCLGNCNYALKRRRIAQHMAAHGYDDFSGQYIKTYYYNKLYDMNDTKTIYSVVDNEIIFITLRKQNSSFYTFHFHNKSNMVGIVYFTHEHDNCRSKEFSFSFSFGLKIDFSDLPKCFKKEDIIYATVRIEYD